MCIVLVMLPSRGRDSCQDAHSARGGNGGGVRNGVCLLQVVRSPAMLCMLVEMRSPSGGDVADLEMAVVRGAVTKAALATGMAAATATGGAAGGEGSYRHRRRAVRAVLRSKQSPCARRRSRRRRRQERVLRELYYNAAVLHVVSR